MNRQGILFGLMIIGVIAARADEPAILNGYGDTKWGMSREAAAKHLKAIEEKENVLPGMDLLIAQGEGPVDRLYCHFYQDKLVAVYLDIKLPPEGRYQGTTVIRQMLSAKYFNNEAVAKSLEKAGIQVSLDNSSAKLLVVPTPRVISRPPSSTASSRVRRVPSSQSRSVPGMHHHSVNYPEVVTISYNNSGLVNRLKAQEEEKKFAETRKTIENLKLEEHL